MGERLNLEIWNNGKVLANAYYHWSGFTSSAAEIVSKALKFIETNIMNNSNDLLYAIRVLEATGAGLTDSEIEYARTLDCLKNAEFAECNGRNEGLLGISENDIESTRFWQEHSAYIFIDEKRVSFRVYWEQRSWEFEREQKEDYDNDIKAKDLSRFNWNCDDIKFGDWNEFYSFIINQHEPWVSTVDPCCVISPIE